MHRADRKPPILWLPALLLAVACSQDAEPPPPQEPDAPATEAVATAARPPAPPPAVPEIMTDVGCADAGAFNAKLYGSLAGNIAWNADNMLCQGMARPEGKGARLRFAGQAGERELQIAFIIAIPGLQPGQSASELPTIVTIIEEGKGRFFSTPDLDSCWTDIESQTMIDEAAGRFAVNGRLYCISPVPEFYGGASVSIQEMSFMTALPKKCWKTSSCGTSTWRSRAIQVLIDSKPRSNP